MLADDADESAEEESEAAEEDSEAAEDEAAVEDADSDEAELLPLVEPLEHPTMPMASMVTNAMTSTFLYMMIPLQSMRLPAGCRQVRIPNETYCTTLSIADSFTAC